MSSSGRSSSEFSAMIVRLIRGLTAVLLIASPSIRAIAQPPQTPQKGLSPRQQELLSSIKWQEGPVVGKLGNVAMIQVLAKHRFTDAAGARAYMEFLGNPPSSQTLGILESSSDDEDWLIEFSYDAIGYVKDDEKDSIDADAILKAIKEGTKQANAQRRSMGASALEITGWEKPPFYDPQTNRLTWAIRGQSEGQPVVNYNTRLLGREGVMSANLIVDPKDLPTMIPAFDNLLKGFNYVPGKTYAEFKSGDRVAEFGLAALVGGGALAVAAKSGFLGKFLKLIIVGVLVIFGVFVKLFRKIFPKKETPAADA
jgi:uncharacterized membrane-anchored protein